MSTCPLLPAVPTARASCGDPGNLCTETWPPKAFKGIDPVEQLELHAGDGIVPINLTRARHAVDWSAEGLVVTSRQGDRRYQQVTETFTLEVFARDSDEELGRSERDGCQCSGRPAG